MHTSRFTTTHQAVYLFERLLVVPITIAVILLSSFERLPAGIASFLLVRVTLLHVIAAVFFMGIWVCCFPARSAIQNSISFTRKFARNLMGILIVTAVLAVLLTKSHVTASVAQVLPLFILSIAILTTIRLLLITALDSGLWRGKSNVLILGTGHIARRAWREMRTKHYRTVNVLGFVDDQCYELGLPEIKSKHLGTVADLDKMFLKTAVDMIVIALPTKSCYDNIQAAIAMAEKAGVDVLQFESVFSLSRLSQQPYGSHNGLYTVRSVGQNAARGVKRLMDIVLAASGLIALSPLLLAITIAIKFTDPGPSLFVQERYGYRRRKFRLFKFRTMVVNAEALMAKLESMNEADGPIFKIKNDPRITPLGRLLRKTSLDELPQLLNVLLGDMSLVGPRPMSLRDVGLFSESTLMRRFSVKPGITGLWQVSGRSNTSFDHWISMDFNYIDQWSFWLDLNILARTIPVVFKGSGAM